MSRACSFTRGCSGRSICSLRTPAGEARGSSADLAVGFDPGGADAWSWQDLLALDVHVGAPPDGFNRRGQDWGLPPFVPWKLRRRALRALDLDGPRRDAVGRRAAGRPRDGAVPAVLDPSERLASKRRLRPRTGERAARPAGAREREVGHVRRRRGSRHGRRRGPRGPRERAVLSTRLLWFEDIEPERFPVHALAAITTHDLPTIAGVWTGADLAAQKRVGMTVSESGATWFQKQLERATGLSRDAPLTRVIVAAHRALADAPSVVVTGTLDDALAVEERPNMPGTIDEWPNWSPRASEAAGGCRDRPHGAGGGVGARPRAPGRSYRAACPRCMDRVTPGLGRISADRGNAAVARADERVDRGARRTRRRLRAHRRTARSGRDRVPPRNTMGCDSSRC